MPYVVKAGRVTFNNRAVRGVDVGTFVELLGGWARDQTAVYFEGSKVSRCAVDRFRPIEPMVGLDHKRAYYRNSRGRIRNDPLSKETLDPHDIDVVGSDDGVHTYLKPKGSVGSARMEDRHSSRCPIVRPAA